MSDDVVNFNAEFSFTPNPNVNCFFFYHRSDRESYRRARQSGGTLSTSTADDWELTLDEITDTWDSGLTQIHG